jgi:hypothetical protein
MYLYVTVLAGVAVASNRKLSRRVKAVPRPIFAVTSKLDAAVAK